MYHKLLHTTAPLKCVVRLTVRDSSLLHGCVLAQKNCNLRQVVFEPLSLKSSPIWCEIWQPLSADSEHHPPAGIHLQVLCELPRLDCRAWMIPACERMSSHTAAIAIGSQLILHIKNCTKLSKHLNPNEQDLAKWVDSSMHGSHA